MFLKRAAVVIVFFALLCAGSGSLFANDLMDSYFNGDDLNRNINSFISSVSGLIPDISTSQSIWSYTPGSSESGGWWGGFGVNMAFAFSRRSNYGSTYGSTDAFGADNINLADFPVRVSYLPLVSLDARVGFWRFDIGMSGMFLDKDILSESAGVTFFGEGSSFLLRSVSFDVRFKALVERNFIPSITVQAGYFWTRLNFGTSALNAGKDESVSVDFRNDSYLIGVQVAYDKLVPYISPFLGTKLIISNTDSEYEWHTHRSVILGGSPYNLDQKQFSYFSASNDGDVRLFWQIYLGLGISAGLDHLFTIGAAYTVGNHFSLNIAIRAILEESRFKK